MANLDANSRNDRGKLHLHHANRPFRRQPNSAERGSGFSPKVKLPVTAKARTAADTQHP